MLGVNGAVEHIQTVLCFSGKNSAIFKSVGIWFYVHRNRIVKTNTTAICFIVFLSWMGLKWLKSCGQRCIDIIFINII